MHKTLDIMALNYYKNKILFNLNLKRIVAWLFMI